AARCPGRQACAGLAAPGRQTEPAGPGATGSNTVVAADNLGLEKAELRREFPVEVALAGPALRLDEAQIDIEAEPVFELLARAIGKLTANEGAARFDHLADFADEFGSGRAHLFQHRHLRLERLQIVLAALRPHPRFGQRWRAKRKLCGCRAVPSRCHEQGCNQGKRLDQAKRLHGCLRPARRTPWLAASASGAARRAMRSDIYVGM